MAVLKKAESAKMGTGELFDFGIRSPDKGYPVYSVFYENMELQPTM
ncbi:hypothetical protein IAE55_19730 [Paenibacillus sp. S28]|nr:hypothetical protein [Paenibacillus sp. S28]